MLAEPTVLALSLAYLGLLFAVAYFGDRYARDWSASSVAPAVYGLSLAIYCTSWTFYGAVGRAATSGIDFIFIYTGPALVVIVGYPMLRKMVRAGQAAQRHLDRRLPRLALRQEPRRRRHRHAVRHGGRAALHRAAAPGGVLDLRHDRRAHAVGRRRARRGPHRHLAGRGGPHGGLHHPVRRAQRAGLRAASRHDAGDRLRVGGQAAGPAGGRSVRGVRPVQRAGRPARSHCRSARRRRAGGARGLAAVVDRDDPALGHGLPLPAAPVPCRGRRARPSGEPQDGALAVSGLPRADQPVRRADRRRRAAAARAARQSRSLCAQAAAGPRRGLALGLRLHRRPVGGDLDGDRRLHGAVGHDRQRAGDALPAAPPGRRRARHGAAGRVRAPRRGGADPGARATPTNGSSRATCRSPRSA